MLRRQQQGCAALLLLALLSPNDRGITGVNAKFRGAKPKPIPSLTADGQVVEGKGLLSASARRVSGTGTRHAAHSSQIAHDSLPALHRCR